MKAEEFKPFSKEWKKEMMKFTKIGLIECLLKPALIKNKELIEALNRISAYQSIETLQKDSEKDWGLEYEEALEMSYENMQNEAKAIIEKNNK